MEQSNPSQPVASRPTGRPRLSKLPIARPSASKSLLPKPSSETLQTRTASTSTHAIPKSPAAQSFKVPFKSSSSSSQHSRIAPKSAVQTSTRMVAPSAPIRTRPASSTASSTVSNASRPTHSSSSSSAPVGDVSEHNASNKNESNATRKPRLSLAERTMESISRVPPSPATRRRRSSFFQQQSPMPTSRPASALANCRGISEHDAVPMPTIRPEVLQRHLQASTRTITRGTRTPARTSIASRTTNTSLRPPEKGTVTAKSPSPSKTSRPLGNSRTVAPRAKTSRPALAGLFNPPNVQGEITQEDKSPKAVAAAKSSLALREQIKAARAAKRTVAVSSVGDAPGDAGQVNKFDLEVDPFNQQPKDGNTAFRRKIDVARSEGRLNISGLALKEIPEDVIKMYDFEYNKSQSNIAWNETVDLVKFIAADNEIESIPDHVFPDVDVLGVSQDDATATPQFGGIELLDLRGNILFDLPVGLRRLERLTSLNLSRNRLMNDSLDTISQIACLKELKISDNVLTGELSPTIANLTQLEVLEVQNNKICSLPPEVSSLVHLRSVNVSSNQLTSLPMTELSTLPLVSILASKNHLSGSLCTSDHTMSRLKTLDVSINSLAAISTHAFNLHELQDLNISFNRITDLPNTSTWTSLTTLLAEDNKLSQLPEAFTQLESLRIVDFTGNDFTKLDPRIGLMDKLQTFKVAANPIRERKFLTMDTAGLKRDLKARLGVDEPGQEVD